MNWYDFSKRMGKKGKHAIYECLCQSLVVGEFQNVVDVVPFGDLHRLVRTAIINYKRFNAVNAVNFIGQILERDGEGGLFIQAGNLDDEFHDE